MEQNSI